MAKGGNFERDVCKYLSKWLTGKEKPYQYWRMPGSGSLCTIHEEMEHMSGDIRPLTEDARFLTDFFSIECKTGYVSTSFWQHFSDIKTFKLREFWSQCYNDAQKSHKYPMLIYRKKSKREIIGMYPDISENLHFCCNIYQKNSIMMEFKQEYNLPSVTFFDMKDFFSLVTPDIMKEFIEEMRYKDEDMIYVQERIV